MPFVTESERPQAQMENRQLEEILNRHVFLGGELDLNFDKDPESSIEDLVSVSIGTWKKIISNDLLWSESVISTLFPKGKTLTLLKDVFEKSSNDASFKRIDRNRFKQLAELLDARLKQHYPH